MDIGLIDADGHTEQWKSVAGYEGYYEVSDAGRVRSVDRSRIVNNRYGGQNRRADKGREIAAVDNGNGYLYVTLSKDGSRRNHYVHRLVAEAFCTKQPNADVVNHINCNKKDDRACNLEWVTTMDNVRYTSDFMKKPKKTCAQSNIGEKYIDTMRELHEYGQRLAMEENEKNMTKAEAPDWCPRINHEVQ